MSAERYKIEKITDILNIPPERLDDFLVDLKSWYEVAKPMAVLVDLIANDVAGIKTQTVPTHMVWVDDNKSDINVIIEPKN